MRLRRTGPSSHSPGPARPHTPFPAPSPGRTPRRQPRRALRTAVALLSSAVLSLAVLPTLALAAIAPAAPAASTAAAVAAPAGLPTSFGPPSPLIGTGVRPGHARRPGDLQFASSTNWSGYAAHTAVYTGVSSTWTEPGASCGSATSYAAFWVGLDGYSSDSVEQTGTLVECYRGAAYQYAWYEMYPANPVYFSSPLKAGDAVSASVGATAAGAFTLTIRDATQNWTQTLNKTDAALSRSSAEIIAEAPSSGYGVLPLADFGTVTFGNATVNGAALSASGPTPITMVASGGQTEVAPSALGAGGTSFSCTWHRS